MTRARRAALVALLAATGAVATGLPASAGAQQSKRVVIALKDTPNAHRNALKALARNGFTVSTDDGHTIVATGPASNAHALKSADTHVAGLGPQKPWHSRTVPGGHTATSLANAYDLVAGDGTGVTIATVQFSGWNSGDLTTYATAAGLPTTAPTEISVGGASPSDTSSGGDVEVALDQEVLRAAAPNATQRIYFGPNTGIADAVLLYSRIATDAENGLVDVVSTSWGMCEPWADLDPDGRAAMETQLQRIVDAGATVFAASGDMGAYDCSYEDAPDNTIAVDYPAASPAVVGVGGTKLTGSTGAWTETAWNEPSSGSFKGYGTGGGESTSVARPSWQAGLGLAGTHRLVPDVAAMADPSAGFGLFAASAGGWILGGGTSAAAPLVAGHLASALSAAGRTDGIGDPHDALYGNPAAFRDITTGSNLVDAATAGYDKATGLGAPRWSTLSAALFGNPVVAAPAYTRTTTIPLTVMPPSGAVTAWTVAEGTTVACDPNGSASPPTGITVAPGDRVVHVVVGALGADSQCRTGVATTVLDTVAPVATASVKALAADVRTVFSWGGPADTATYDVCAYAVGTGCFWTQTATTARSATLNLTQGRTYQLRVTAVDRAGNRGAETRSALYVVPIDEKSLSRSRGWSVYSNKGDWYGTHAQAARNGMYLTKTLTGTKYELMYVKQSAGGYMDVYVNGVRVKRINTYSATTAFRQVVTIGTYATRAARTIKVVVISARDSRSRGTNVAVDAIRVTY
jgi:hypothetical protein